MQQYQSPRYPAVETYCRIPDDHPKYLEPSYQCHDDTCLYCPLYADVRSWIDACYHAQHQVNPRTQIEGTEISRDFKSFMFNLAIIQRGVVIMSQIIKHRAFSLLSMRRKQINQRGSPMRAAAMWCLVEEIRISCEKRWNEDIASEIRPFREKLKAIIGKILALL